MCWSWWEILFIIFLSAFYLVQILFLAWYLSITGPLYGSRWLIFGTLCAGLFIFSPNSELPTLVLPYLGGQESVQMWVEGEDRMVGNSLQELVQSFHPRLHELLRKTINHALHHELLRQRLEGEERRRRKEEKQSRGCKLSVSRRKAGQRVASWLVSPTGMRWVGWLSSNLILSQSKSW